MPGETNLSVLLKSMEPEPDAGEYIFCSTAESGQGVDARDAWAVISEDEGKTLILKRESADRCGVRYESVFRKITLKIHSSLDAVGLTAAVSAALARQGISANVVAGYYHDHIFVQSANAAEAVDALKKLAAENNNK
ncbi:MAG TPA: acetyltransferase [Treponema sp.]|nr:acetyltransferase [Treponema sp.]